MGTTIPNIEFTYMKLLLIQKRTSHDNQHILIILNLSYGKNCALLHCYWQNEKYIYSTFVAVLVQQNEQKEMSFQFITNVIKFPFNLLQNTGSSIFSVTGYFKIRF